MVSDFCGSFELNAFGCGISHNSHTLQPNTKRRFADDDPSDEDYTNNTSDEPVYRGGGKQLGMMGKQLQRPPVMDSDDDDSDDDDDDHVAQPIRGGGKHFRPSGGKQLRVM